MTHHRVCMGTEHDPANGKVHGRCVICGEPWPCDIEKRLSSPKPQQRTITVDFRGLDWAAFWIAVAWIIAETGWMPWV